MSKLNYTYHAKNRALERSIPFSVIEFIYLYGKSFQTHEHKKYFFNRSLLRKYFFIDRSFIKKYEKQILNTALVCNGNFLITVMKKSRFKRWN